MSEAAARWTTAKAVCIAGVRDDRMSDSVPPPPPRSKALIPAARRASSLARSTSTLMRSGSMGFCTYSAAPALTARTAVSIEPKAVTTTTCRFGLAAISAGTRLTPLSAPSIRSTKAKS